MRGQSDGVGRVGRGTSQGKRCWAGTRRWSACPAGSAGGGSERGRRDRLPSEAGQALGGRGGAGCRQQRLRQGKARVFVGPRRAQEVRARLPEPLPTRAEAWPRSRTEGAT